MNFSVESETLEPLRSATRSDLLLVTYERDRLEFAVNVPDLGRFRLGCYKRDDGSWGFLLLSYCCSGKYPLVRRDYIVPVSGLVSVPCGKGCVCFESTVVRLPVFGSGHVVGYGSRGWFDFSPVALGWNDYDMILFESELDALLSSLLVFSFDPFGVGELEFPAFVWAGVSYGLEPLSESCDSFRLLYGSGGFSLGRGSCGVRVRAEHGGAKGRFCVVSC